MSHHLHADTAALRAARVAAEELRAALRPEALDPRDLAVLTAVPGGAVVSVEHDRLLAAVARSVGELARLDAALDTAARVLETAEQTATRSLAAP